MKCQSMFSEKNKKKNLKVIGDSFHEMPLPVFWENKKTIISLSSAELAQRVVKVKGLLFALCLMQN